MSAALVRKGLDLVDSDFTSSTGSQKSRKNKGKLEFIPQNHKIFKSVVRKGQKATKVNVLKTERKITIEEARKNYKPKEKILEENLQKLQQIREACTIDLDPRITEKLIERAITRRPVKTKRKFKKSGKTAFTEEDFVKFEEEYTGE